MNNFWQMVPATMIAATLSISAWAGEVAFKLQGTSSGGTQFRLIANGLCDYGNATSFSMNRGVIEGRRFRKTSKYISKSNKDEWRVTNDCRINQQVTDDLLEPGKALEVVIYDDRGYEIDRYYAVVPCQKDFKIIEKQSIFTRDLQLVEAVVCDTKQGDTTIVKDVQASTIGTQTNSDIIVITTPTQDQLPEVEQNCSLSASVNGAAVRLTAGCIREDILAVEVLNEGQVVFSNYVKVKGGTYYNAASYQTLLRDETKNISLTIRAHSERYNENFSRRNVVIQKVPTFTSMVKIAVLSSNLQTPKAQDKALGRGVYYEAQVEVAVQDNDIDPNYPENEILVELISLTDGQNQVIDSRRVSTGKTARFSLTGEYIRPLLFGSDHWDEESPLQKGTNTFKVRVYDAYGKTTYKESDVIEVIVK
ncbi:MAG: hypothetical protein KDD34_05890 [Bdellovibrionales bacterium]|nr:hypothetical protein [Bdellovibrionales bacterium]